MNKKILAFVLLVGLVPVTNTSVSAVPQAITQVWDFINENRSQVLAVASVAAVSLEIANDAALVAQYAFGGPKKRVVMRKLFKAFWGFKQNGGWSVPGAFEYIKTQCGAGYKVLVGQIALFYGLKLVLAGELVLWGITGGKCALKNMHEKKKLAREELDNKIRDLSRWEDELKTQKEVFEETVRKQELHYKAMNNECVVRHGEMNERMLWQHTEMEYERKIYCK